MSCVAVITARGGSKRIPRKNLRDFCGKPIITYSIEAALKAAIFDEVMVSTDSEEIADIAIQAGAIVPFMRSDATSNDYAGTNDVLLEVLGKYSNQGRKFETMCCIYPTAPFISPKKLIDAYNLMQSKGAKKIIPVVSFSYPPQRAMLLDNETGELRLIYPKQYDLRSQDLDKWYHDAGQFYYYDVDSFVESHGKIADSVFPFIVSEIEVQDIDNEEDWIIAEMKYQNMIGIAMN